MNGQIDECDRIVSEMSFTQYSFLFIELWYKSAL